MNSITLYVDKRPLRLGRRIGKGGEGEVYAIDDDPTLAVKIYTTRDKAQREAKISAIVGSRLALHAPLVAFPMFIARSVDGAFSGFVMRLVGNHKPLHELYSPGSRKIHFPQADYRFLVRTAANIAKSVALVHRSGCVIGDINHSGILVSSKATVALIDADSFQIASGTTTFRCLVGVPEYTPPELQGHSLADVVRTPNHDAFGLAVVIFQLLFMGRHPFVGTPRRGETPPLHEAIRDFRYVYDDSRDVGMDQPPGTPSLDRFFPPIALAFDEAFGRNSRDQRPTADRWAELLAELEKSLVSCDENRLHFTPKDADDCAWCELERQTGSVLFVPHVPRPDLVSPEFDPGARGFNIESIWTRIESLTLPSMPTELTPASIAPSADAMSGRRTPVTAVLVRIAAALATAALIYAVPSAWFIWLGLGYVIWNSVKTNVPPNIASFQSRYLNADRAYRKAREDLERRSGILELIALKRDLALARDCYRRLASDEKQQIESYRSQRRSLQLHAFLDTFDVRHTRIRGIGPAKLAILLSFGIDTAADIDQRKLLTVTGFGPVTVQPLLEWRAKLERRFVYREQQTEADVRELAKIRAATEARASSLRKTLSAGFQNLDRLVVRAKQVLASPDPVVMQAAALRDQAASDLQFLDLPIPAAQNSNTINTISPQSSTAPPKRISSPSAATRPCPRCGSSMVKRIARRGRNAGGQFWGCSRFPVCKGTRNV